jgi:hypothetical protein
MLQQYSQTEYIIMSVIANGSVNQILLQQSLINSPPESPAIAEDKTSTGRQEAVIIDVADLTSSRWTQVKQEALLKKVTMDVTTNPLETQKSQGSDVGSHIAAQEAALEEKQNELEIKASTGNVEYLRTFIAKAKDTAIGQQANQSKEHTIALMGS